MNKNAQYTQEYLDIVSSLEGDVASRRAARSYILNSTAYYHGKPIGTTYVPRFFSEETYDEFKHIAETTHGICCKIMQHYFDDESYRELFNYDPRLVELILMDRHYPDVLPFMRLDVFFNEDSSSCGFCEMNADGSSGMDEMLQLHESFAASAALSAFAEKHEVFESDLFHPWIHKFLDIYERFEGSKENPRVAIVDYLEHGTVDEFKLYARQFAQHGIECHIVDVRELRYENGVLATKDGMPIDAIWRRAVTNDILENWDASQDFIAAVREGAVALIGSFAGHIVHDKQIFMLMRYPETQAFLTEEENQFVEACVPYTAFLNSESGVYENVVANKDEWIIKPTDKYGACAVFAGKLYQQSEWKSVVDQHMNEASGMPYLAQRYVSPYQTSVIVPNKDLFKGPANQVEIELARYNNLTGLYLFNGEFAGVYTRLGPAAVISDVMDDVTSAAYWVDCNW